MEDNRSDGGRSLCGLAGRCSTDERSEGKCSAADNGPSEEIRNEHPSLKRENVSSRAIFNKFAPKGLSTSFMVASAVALATIFMLVFAAQFLPTAFVVGGESFYQLIYFQDTSFAFFLVALASPLVLRHATVGMWIRAGAVFLVAVSIWICFYMAAVVFDAALQIRAVMVFVAHALFGMSLGLAICNWTRLFVSCCADTPLQIGLAIVVAAFGSAILAVIPPAVQSVAVALLPLLIAVLLFHLRSVACLDGGISQGNVMEDEALIRVDKTLVINLSVVGFVYGGCFGFVVSDYATTQMCSLICVTATAIVGLAITAYYLKTGRNLGYTLPTSALIALTAMGQGLLSIFGEDYLPATFSILFMGQLLFEAVLLLQLPRIFEKIRSLVTFFLLLFIFHVAQFLGVVFRNLLWIGLPPYTFRIVSAVLLCLVIGAMAYTLHDSSVSTAWGLLPVPSYPRKRYAHACESIKARYSLTPRETEIMMMVGRGRNGTFIQEKLLISKSTYQTHMRNLYKKLDIHSDQELIDLIEFALDSNKKQ